MKPRGGNGFAQAHYRDYGKMTYARSVSVIHNIAHQGRAPMAEMGSLEVPDSYSHLVCRCPRPRPAVPVPVPAPAASCSPRGRPPSPRTALFLLSHSQSLTHGGLVGSRLRGAAPRDSCGPVCLIGPYLPGC